jgi:L-ascorbate metabolism protein UlaG (beta-lactamase superfamily)
VSVAFRLALIFAVLTAAIALVRPAQAQSGVDRCLAVASAPPRLPVHRVSSTRAKLAKDQVEITFVGHSTFQIESPLGVRAATDFGDYFRPPQIPNIVTMNRAHTSHYTDNPPAGITHVLRGWNPLGGPAQHDIELKDVRVRNVPTNTRWSDTGTYGAFGNSIFIFEIARMCIGHLGHLHHTLTPEQIGQIGQLDVVLVPVDGGYTMDVAGMIDVLKALKARLIIPMHYFNPFTLDRFLDRLKGEIPVERSEAKSVVISHETLPAEMKVLVLPGL